MSGKLCNGLYDQTAVIRNSKAFCEGMNYRAQGSAAAYPKTDNPLSKDPEAEASWDAGWDVADDAGGSSIAQGDSGCCGLDGVAISA